MVAQVIVNHNAKQVDKFFDYLVPEELEDRIASGMRVIVPFGRNNKNMEAYVMGVKEHTNAKKLKSVIRLVEDTRLFDEKMQEVFEWAREKYLCTYLDMIHAAVPAGISVKPEQWLALENENEQGQTETKRKIIEKIRDNGGAMEVNRISQDFPGNIRRQINELCADGILKREYRDVRGVKDKLLRVAYSTVLPGEAADVMRELEKRAPVQAKMMEILLVNEFLSLSDLVQFSGGSYQAIVSLTKKGLIETKDIVVSRNPLMQRAIKEETPPSLTDEQRTACERMEDALNHERQETFLLHGVTGSGKTEVFLQIIKRVLDMGKTAVMLVPEISLTPQMVGRFLARFPDEIAVLHSGLSLGEKYDEWKRIRDGKARIVIGARSAVFAPLSDVGVIIMDEEHEQTYKSEMIPRYHAREVAQFRVKQYGALLVLASATPDVESYYRAERGEYTLLSMPNRAGSGTMPEVEVVDMRQELERGNKSIFSVRLAEEIQKNLDAKEQTILFLNRRGFSTFVSCRSCGYVAECPNCNISLTYHRYNDTLRCHYCGHTTRNYEVCPVCGSKYIRYFGGGTQKVEEEMKRMFPMATTVRMDVDTTGRKNAHEKILSSFEKEKIDILIGTQMVTKGLDFGNVTLVGVVSADTVLHIDDYRSGEKTFDLLEQVAGRAGRAEKPGRAIVQTYNPEHEAIQMMKQHDYIGFYEKEIEVRRALWYPPFCKIVSVLFTGPGEHVVGQAARFFARQLAPLREIAQRVQVLGPVPAAISKIKNKYRWRLLIKCENEEEIKSVLTDAKEACYNRECYENITIVIDQNIVY
jgi:primosomal protein N' (replication factor Y)